MSKLKAPGAPTASRLARGIGGLKPPTAKPVAPAETTPAKQRLSSDSSSITEPAFEVGDRVLVSGIKPGTVEFIGCTQFAKGIWAGVVLDTPDGKNDGMVNGVRYFTSPPNHGLFSRPDKLMPVPRQKNQPPRISLSSTGQLRSQQPPPVTEDVNFSIGDRVTVDGSKVGTVSFVGPTMFAKGIWVGVTLDAPEGKNSGAVAGVQYFECEPNCGVFTRPAKVTLLNSPQNGVSSMPTTSINNPPPNAGQPTPNIRGAPPTGGPSLSAEELRAKAEQLHDGDRVMVNGSKEGTLRFIGPTHFAKGIWVGVELDMPQGKNDGAVSGKRYFQCQALHGLFAPLPKVERIGGQPSSPQSHGLRGPGGRNLSTSSHSSISSLSSLTKLRQQQQQLQMHGMNEAGRSGSPVENLGAGSEGLSHIMFEKDHLIATLQSSLDQANQEKLGLSEQVTDLQRKVDDLKFRLEEQSVVSDDQLEEVETREGAQLRQLQSQLEKEIQKNAYLVAGRTALESAKLQLEEKLEIVLNEKKQLEGQSRLMSGSNSDQVDKLAHELTERDRQVTEVLKDAESLKLENEKLKKELKAAEVDYKTAEEAAQNLQATADSTSQQLQETLELCAQQESLLEEKLNELQTLDEQKRVLERDVDRMTLERSQLVASHEQTAAERDRAIAECDRLRSETNSVSQEQDSLAQQRRQLLQERDQARAELRDTIQLYEQMKAERDEVQIQFEELSQQKQQVQGFSQEINTKFDGIQKELSDARSQIERLERENSSLSDQLDHQKYHNEQKIALTESMSGELKQRLESAVEERDMALQQAQRASDALERITRERREMMEQQAKYHTQIEELQYKMQEATQSYNVYNDEARAESDAVKQQLEDIEELLAGRERELQEAKERIVSLEEELVINSSQAVSQEKVAALEEANLSLEKNVEQLAKQLKERQTTQGSSSQSNNDEEKIALQTELKDKEQEIAFLNSVIADLQVKNEALEALNGLGSNAAALGYLDTSEEDLMGHVPARMFCDICEVFDQHDTGDCPHQTQSDTPPPTTHQIFRSQERPYCDNCEVFGHWTEECDYEETY